MFETVSHQNWYAWIKCKLKPFNYCIKKCFLRDKILSNEGDIVLSYLREFCNVTKSGFTTDPLELARNEGRREVFLEISRFLNMDFSRYYELHETDIED